MAWAYDPASRSLLPPHVAVGAGVGAGPPPGSRERQPAAFCTTNFGNFLKVSMGFFFDGTTTKDALLRPCIFSLAFSS